MIIDRKRIKHLQTYKVKGTQEHMYVWTDTGRRNAACGIVEYDAYTAICEGELTPSIHCTVSLNYLREDCRPVSYAKLPSQVQAHLLTYVNQNI